MNLLIRVILIATILLLLVAATFRSTGLDYGVYLAEFLDPVNSLSSHEIGYVALIMLVGQIAGFWLVLLVSNATFLFSHLKVYAETRTVAQFAAFLMYISYVGLFLIYGSPRRLIAYSIVSYVILEMAYEPHKSLRSIGRNSLLTASACAFHASAVVFIPVLVAYGYGRSQLSRSRRLFGLLVMIAGVCSFIYISGAFDYLVDKILYYSLYASTEQAYLKDVPSVASGLMKRFVALMFLWHGSQDSPNIRRPALDFCVIETVLYVALGSVSPVLAVVASYFAIGYLLPSLQLQTRNGMLTMNSLTLMSGAAIYYVPTSYGLIKLFGDFYVS